MKRNWSEAANSHPTTLFLEGRLFLLEKIRQMKAGILFRKLF
jgi:hypothetical protein